MEDFAENLLEVADDPRYRSVLERVLAHEDRVLGEGGWHQDGTYDGRPLGWEWHDVQVMPVYLMQLAHAGVVSIVFKSNKHTDYRLTDPELVRKALDGTLARDLGQDEGFGDPLIDMNLIGLFDPVVGYADLKSLFVAAVLASKPVHVLLEGPPASAKTLFLMELGRMPGARYAVGGTSTKAGLTDLLFTHRPRYLLIDEMELIDNVQDYAVLLSLMESGIVSETKYKRRRTIHLDTWVFAACNDASSLPAPLLSRFKPSPIRLREYTPDEFRGIATRLLVAREDLPEAFAAQVANATLQMGSRDVRYAVNLSRMARTEEQLEAVLRTLRQHR